MQLYVKSCETSRTNLVYSTFGLVDHFSGDIPWVEMKKGLENSTNASAIRGVSTWVYFLKVLKSNPETTNCESLRCMLFFFNRTYYNFTLNTDNKC